MGSLMIRVVIVDDDHLMRAGLVELLGADASIAVVGEAATGREAVERSRQLRPDVVLMDVQMPDLDGIEATREITRSAPDCKVIVLTTFDQDDYLFNALQAGASGFLLKRSRPEDLIAAVHIVATGDALLSPAVTRRVIDRITRRADVAPRNGKRIATLTVREREVFDVLARGLSNREIAAALFVEESTIRTHVKRVLMKLELRDRIQAVIYAYETGLCQPGVGTTARSRE